MLAEMESTGIIFTIQWKKKSGNVNRQGGDVTSIGLWDPEGSTLDWQTFKSYVCQNTGTMDDISVAYVDSSGDELPIESECEFREALKFARQRSCNGHATVLKLDRQQSVESCVPNAVLPGHVKPKDPKSLQASCSKQKNKIGLKTSYKSIMKGKTNSHTLSSTNSEEKKFNKDHGNKYITEKSEPTVVDHGDVLMSVLEKLEKFNLEQVDTPPQWFRRYMQKFKSEIVAEVTTSVLQEIQQALRQQNEYNEVRNSNSWCLSKNKSKKKLSDEESSDGALGNESRDHKLLKKIAKLHKREKKLEKKLDSKLEKLENKTKRMMEKRSQCKARCEKMPDRKLCSVKRRSGDLHFGTYLMDAILLNDGPSSEIVINPGEQFSKVWEIMNAGTLPWTDKTELRQAWGTCGLEPEETVVKCPILQPGETGTIRMQFHAPDFPGKFKSFWHFYHMGDRFGHWLGCTVVVKDAKDTSGLELNDHVLNRSIENDFATDNCVDNKSENENDIQHFKIERGQEKPVSPNTRREHFESDVESDNLSVISGPGSYTFNSEDENFVIIPMPACFVRDVPLGHTETIPVMVKSDTIENKISENPVQEETVEECSSSEDNKNSEITNESNHESSDQYEMYEDQIGKIVYAVDPSGRCVVVSYSNDLSATHSFQTNHQTRISVQNNIRDQEYSSEYRSTNNERQENTAPSSVNSDTNNTFTDSPASHNVHQNILGESSSSANRRPPLILQKDPLANIIRILPEPLVAGAVNVATNDERPENIASSSGNSDTNNTFTDTPTSDNGHQNILRESSSSASQRPPLILQKDPLTNIIHILPEPLVAGAVSVASSAFSTARAVISNLRARQQGDEAEWQWPEGEVPPTDHTTAQNLERLVEMGFENRILNVLLLQKYCNDLNKVVAELLSQQ